MPALPLPCRRTRAPAVRKGPKGLSAFPLQWPPLRPLLDRRQCGNTPGTLAIRSPARPKFGQRRGRQMVRRRHGRARRSHRPHPPELWVSSSERDLGRGALVAERAQARTGAENATRAGPAQRVPSRKTFAIGRPVLGTLAEAYLRARGITAPLDQLSSLRFHPGCYYRIPVMRFDRA